MFCLHGIKINGVLATGALKTFTALVMKGSSFSPKFSIVIPKAHLDITFTVKVLKILRTKMDSSLIFYGASWQQYFLASICPSFWEIDAILSASSSAHVFIKVDICEIQGRLVKSLIHRFYKVGKSLV